MSPVPRAPARHQRGQRPLLCLQRRLVDDQPRRDGHDALDLDKAIGAQRVAGGHHVHDGIGQPHQRGQLHRAVELDDVDVNALAGEVAAGGVDVLGGHPQALAGHRCPGVVEALARGHGQPAAGNAQVHRLEDALAAVLQHHVTPGDAQIGRAMLHVGGHVAGPHNQQAQARIVSGQDELAAVHRRRIQANAALRQQSGRVFQDPSLGQGQRQHLLPSCLINVVVWQAARPLAIGTYPGRGRQRARNAWDGKRQRQDHRTVMPPTPCARPTGLPAANSRARSAPPGPAAALPSAHSPGPGGRCVRPWFHPVRPDRRSPDWPKPAGRSP